MGTKSSPAWIKSSNVGEKSLPAKDGLRSLGLLKGCIFCLTHNFLSWLWLDLPDVSRLTNDPIPHSPYWHPVPTKIPSGCPTFEGKAKEDPQAHVMTYQLWCSSNSYIDDSIHLLLFQRTLIGAAAKWHIELPPCTYGDFNSLVMDFLTHFQFLV